MYTKKILPLGWQGRYFFYTEMLRAGRPAGSHLSAVYFEASALGIVGGQGLERELDGNIGRLLSAGGTSVWEESGMQACSCYSLIPLFPTHVPYPQKVDGD